MSINEMLADKTSPDESIFSETGELSRYLQNFRYRPQQQAMCKAVETTIANYGQLVVEAGTGVGKTFALLNFSVSLTGAAKIPPTSSSFN